MPTGYTQYINDGVDFKEYALRCARAFGACIMQKEDSSDVLPEKQNVSDYHTKAITKTKRQLKSFLNMTEKQLKAKWQKEHNAEIKRYSESEKENIKRKENHLVILKQAEKWEPPTKEHQGLKDFMIKQINLVLPNEFNTYSHDIPDFPIWKDEFVESCSNNIVYHVEAQKKKAKSTNERNKWIDDLHKNLESK